MAFSIENRAMRAGDIVERITPKTNPAEIDWAHIKDTYHFIHQRPSFLMYLT